MVDGDQDRTDDHCVHQAAANDGGPGGDRDPAAV